MPKSLVLKSPERKAPVPKSLVLKPPGPKALALKSSGPKAPLVKAPVPKSLVLKSPGQKAPGLKSAMPKSLVLKTPVPKAPVVNPLVPKSLVLKPPGPNAPVLKQLAPQGLVLKSPGPKSPALKQPAPQAPTLKTLDRVISKSGAGSRTEARSWIGTGRVHVNGQLIQTPDHWVDIDRDKVTLDGKPLGKADRRYILLYKPKGYLTTYHDPEGRPTVYALISGIDQFVGTVGRLDLDTSGLLLLTNDTQLAEGMTNPERKLPKTYLVKASSLLPDDQLKRLASGIDLNDGPTRPATVTRLRDSEKYTFFEITITEGRNRQVRRMVEAIGAKVLKLVRTRLGPLTLEGLKWADGVNSRWPK